MFQTISNISTSRQKDLILTVMGLALMAACANCSIPLQPVPITLQTVGVLLIGLTYTPRQAAYTMGSYILLGALGAPVFSNFRGGFHMLLSTTGGYIFGSFFAAVTMAWLIRKLPTNAWWGMLLNSLVGSAIIYMFGISQLAYLMGWEKAWQLGFMPFIIPGIFKTFLLSGAVYGVKVLR